MGRMWHSLLLGKWKELFFWLPIEEPIQSQQKEYYDALGVADKQADSAGFVELMLEIIGDSLKEVILSCRTYGAARSLTQANLPTELFESGSGTA